MRVSSDGVDLIKDYEKLRLEAYDDGGGIPTIGWGHTKGVRWGDTCTKEEADAWLLEDILEAEEEVTRWVEVELSQSMYDALVSWEFNTGGTMIGNPQRPSRVLQAINERRWADASEELMHWNLDNGEDRQGLCRRRAREIVLFHKDRWPR